MSGLLQIRNVPEQTRRVLKARAAAQGESLNQYLLELIDREASRPTVDEVLSRAAERSERATASALDAIGASRSERETAVRTR
ncbi:MAG TPA: hypothetical protein VGH11_01135 [Jatrophihabitans sp.]|jgi:plasmid stability protein